MSVVLNSFAPLPKSIKDCHRVTPNSSIKVAVARRGVAYPEESDFVSSSNLWKERDLLSGVGYSFEFQRWILIWYEGLRKVPNSNWINLCWLACFVRYPSSHPRLVRRERGRWSRINWSGCFRSERMWEERKESVRTLFDFSLVSGFCCGCGWMRLSNNSGRT